MNAGFSGCTIQTAGKYIFAPSDVLNDSHFNQATNALMELFIQRLLIEQCIYRKEIRCRQASKNMPG